MVEVPRDESVLQLVGTVLRSVGKGSKVTEAYAAASAAQPGNIGLLCDLFAAYVKCASLTRLRQIHSTRVAAYYV